MRIATHNSGTGEQSGGWLPKLFSVFAKCQDKTLVEQYQCGGRLFDLRIRKNKKGVWVFSNGLWESKNPVGYALSDEAIAEKIDENFTERERTESSCLGLTAMLV